MKKVSLLVSVLFILNGSFLSAQTGKGKMLIGVSSSLSVAGTGSDLMSLGVSNTKYKSDASSSGSSENDKTTSINFLPKVGFFVADNFVLGIDLSAAVSNDEYSYTVNTSTIKFNNSSTLISAGPFIRYYVPAGKVMPYFELGGGIGLAKSKYTATGGFSGNTDEEDKSGILSVGGGVGIATLLGDKASFDVMLGYNSMTVKDKKDNPDNERTIMGTLGLKLGFIIYLGAN